jgi:hypothetical protein
MANWLNTLLQIQRPPTPGTAGFAPGQDVMPTGAPSRRPIGTLPTSARVPSQYPAGVAAGVGGGNAGGSRAGQWSRPPAPRQPPPPGNQPLSGPAQQNPRLPAGRNVAIVNPPQRARNRALSNAAQNAGLPAWNWQAEENRSMFEAAEAAGQAAAAARQAQGGRGYLPAMSPGEGWNAPTADQAVMTAQAAGALDGLRPGATSSEAVLAGQAAGAFDGGIGRSGPAPAALPDISNPATQAYRNRADIRTWEAANPLLAQRLWERSGSATPPAANLAAMTTAAAQSPSGDFSGNPNWTFNAPAAGRMERLTAAAADQPGFNLANVTGGDFRPGPALSNFDMAGVTQDTSFPVPAGNVLPGGAAPIDDAAQERLRGYLQRIKQAPPAAWNWNQGAGS